jgi:hypothetical protein
LKAKLFVEPLGRRPGQDPCPLGEVTRHNRQAPSGAPLERFIDCALEGNDSRAARLEFANEA